MEHYVICPKCGKHWYYRSAGPLRPGPYVPCYDCQPAPAHQEGAGE